MRGLAIAIVFTILLAGCSARSHEDADLNEAEAPEGSGAEAPGDMGAFSEKAPDNETITPSWGMLDTAIIRPGTMIASDAGLCTTNFVFHNDTDLFIATAAHCMGFERSPGTEERCEPVGIPAPGVTATIEGASRPLELVYSSWYTMMRDNEQDTDTCSSNDFALLRIDPADWAITHPAMHHFGGPTGLVVANDLPAGAKLMFFGRTPLLPDEGALRQHEGYVAMTGEQVAGGWAVWGYFPNPGVPGDSGSGVISADGLAVGPMNTLSALGTNGVANLAWALDYMREHEGWVPKLATTELLEPGILPSGP